MAADWSQFALLLVDIQQDFWTDEIEAAFPDYAKNVSGLLRRSRAAGIDVVHLRAAFLPDRSDWMVRYRLRGAIPCVDGTAGADVLAFARPLAGEQTMTKQTFDGFLNPALDRYLASRQKRFVFVAGLVTSVCVLLTAASAAQRGYLVAVVEDCTADTPVAHRHTLDRYPFIFDRATAATVFDRYDEWSAMLAETGS